MKLNSEDWREKEERYPTRLTSFDPNTNTAYLLLLTFLNLDQAEHTRVPSPGSFSVHTSTRFVWLKSIEIGEGRKHLSPDSPIPRYECDLTWGELIGSQWWWLRGGKWCGAEEGGGRRAEASEGGGRRYREWGLRGPPSGCLHAGRGPCRSAPRKTPRSKGPQAIQFVSSSPTFRN